MVAIHCTEHSLHAHALSRNGDISHLAILCDLCDAGGLLGTGQCCCLQKQQMHNRSLGVIKAQAFHKVLEDALEDNQLAEGTGEGDVLGMEGADSL